jgi:hypothetical protein
MALFGSLALFKGRKHADPWRQPVSLDQGNIGRICLGMNRHGLAQATWENRGRLWSQTLVPRPDASMVCFPLGPGREPRMAVNLEGAGVVAWIADGPDGCALMGLPVTTGQEPGSTRGLFRTAGAVHDLQLAADRRGGALLVWTHEGPDGFEVMAKHFDIRAQAWDEEPARLGPPAKQRVLPRLAMNRRGQAVVAWSQVELGAEGLMASYFFPSMRQWSDRPVQVAGGLVQDNQLGMDHAGNLMVLLVRQEYGQRPRLEAQLHSAAVSSWLPVELLANPWDVGQVRLAMSGGGNALAAWLQNNGTAASYLHVRGFRDGVWEEQSARLEPEQGVVERFDLAMGPRGRVTVLSLARHQAEHYPVAHELGHGWSEAAPVGGRIGEALSQPLLGLSDRCAVALWRSGEGDRTRLRMSQRFSQAG